MWSDWPNHRVKETALDAKKLGFEVHVIENLTEPVNEGTRYRSTSADDEAGIIMTEIGRSRTTTR